MSEATETRETETRDPQTEDPALADRRRRRTVHLAAGGLFVGCLALVALVSSDADVDGETRAEPVPVDFLTAELASGYTVERSFIGRVEARRESRVGFELDGRVDRVAVDEGDRVDRGAVVAELDTDRLRTRRHALVAQRDQADAQARLAEITRERVHEAKGLDAVSSQALDEAELGLQVRRAALAQATAAVEQIDVELAKSRLRAPFDALVAGRSVDEGQVVSAGSPVLHLLERTRPRARIGVAGPAAASLAPGQAVEVEIDGRPVPATVEAILPVREPGTRTVDVLLELRAELGAPSASHGVRGGDLARLRVAHRVDEEGFWLPTAALTESSRGLWAVYVLGADQTLERRELEVLHEEADRVFVRGTLVHGERVAASGLHRLVPGLRVRPTEGASS